MFERFTDRARRVLVIAQEEARLLGHNFIGTEHILIALIQEGEGVAAKALEALGVDPEVVRRKVEETIGPARFSTSGSPPFTPRAKKVLELSLREALQLGHNYIGTEHMLLGVVREGQGVAAQVLEQLGVELPAVRREVIRLLQVSSGPPERASSRLTGAANQAMAAAHARAGTEPVGTHHVLLALFDQEGSLAAKVLARSGVELAAIEGLVDEIGIADTTDESPEAAGGRKVAISVDGDAVVVRVHDPHLVAVMKAGFDESALLTAPQSDDLMAKELSRIWAAVAHAASDLAGRRVQQRAAPSPRNDPEAGTQPIVDV